MMNVTLFLLVLCSDGGFGKVIPTSHYLNTSFVGGVSATGNRHFRRTSKPVINNQKLIPHLRRTESGRVDFLERFSHYVGKIFRIFNYLMNFYYEKGKFFKS